MALMHENDKNLFDDIYLKLLTDNGNEMCTCFGKREVWQHEMY